MIITIVIITIVIIITTIAINIIIIIIIPIGYIIVTEFCERLAYYGFAGSLVLFFQTQVPCLYYRLHRSNHAVTATMNRYSSDIPMQMLMFR
jgi:hypothetical protein